MKKLRLLKLLIIIIVGTNNSFSQRYTKTYINDANKVGIEWWKNVNKGEYELAYWKLDDDVKKRATLEEWSTQMSILMQEVGKIQSRKVLNSYFKSEIDGLENGFYVIIEYSVKYSKTKNHNENLILKQSDNFIWQILDFDYSFQFKK